MRSQSWLLCASLALPLASATLLHARCATAQAQPSAADRAQARQSFRDGVAAYTRGDYTAALAAFQTAYRLAPHPSVRVNMANCYVQLHQPAEALTHFEQFLAESPSAPPPQRSEVERQVADLRRQLGEVHVRVQPDSALNPLVLVDSRPVSTSGPVRIAPGRHTVEISADGFAPERREVDVAAGARADLDVRLRPAAAAATSVTGSATGGASPLPTSGAEPTASSSTGNATSGTVTQPPGPESPPPSTPPPRRGLPPAYFIASVAVAGVAGLTALGCGIGALATNGTFESAARRIANGEGDLAAEQQRGRDAASTARALAIVTDVSLAVTVAGGVAAVVLATQTRFGGERAVTVTPVASAHGGGLSIGGRF